VQGRMPAISDRQRREGRTAGTYRFLDALGSAELGRFLGCEQLRAYPATAINVLFPVV
jgi:hypothetical protein